MTYGIITRVAAPGDTYDTVHEAVMAHAARVGVDGLLLHIGRITADGFEVIEVWESKEHMDAFNDAVVGPALAEVYSDRPPSGPPPVTEEFDVRGLVIPAANLAS